MIKYLHCSRLIEKQLKAMRKSGKKGELAAIQCKQIIAHLKNKGLQGNILQCKRTKYGEYRISNCVKYDLGNGYRLVTIRNDENLFITFAGSHDKTDQWIERHKNDVFCHGDPVFICEELKPLESKGNYETGKDYVGNCESDPYEEQLQEKIDDSLLKSIFRGLLPPCLVIFLPIQKAVSYINSLPEFIIYTG